MSINIVDVLIRRPCLATSFGEQYGKPMECVVVWVHPLGRFYRVRFATPAGSWTETFYTDRATEDERG